MPQWGNQDYKRAVFEQLAQGSGRRRGSLPAFRELLGRCARVATSRRGSARRSIPRRSTAEQIEPQFRTAAQKMQPNERPEIAQDLLDRLHQRGLAPRWLQKMLGLRPPTLAGLADDVAKLAEYSRQNHPEVFRRVMADKPFLVRWLTSRSSPRWSASSPANC